MIDTIKMVLLPKDAGLTSWDVEMIISKLNNYEKFKLNDTQIKIYGWLRNFKVSLYNNELTIEGSIAKYFNRNNIQNFDWRSLDTAVKFLGEELDIPLYNAKISRIDIGINIELDYAIPEYFYGLKNVEYCQRISRHRTTLRYEKNSFRHSFILYDKLVESASNKKKLIKDIEYYKPDVDNLIRIELQLQERVNEFFKTTDLRMHNLTNPQFCKTILKSWIDFYQSIRKDSILCYPKSYYGSLMFDKFTRRIFVQIYGWENLELLLTTAVKQNCLTPSNKSKKLKQYKIAMKDSTQLEFEDHIKELNHKVKCAYVEGLKQIFKMKPNILSN